MKTYYHGTVKSYLPSILKEGLIPNKNKWKAQWLTFNIIPSGSVAATLSKGVYLTPEEWIAKEFAIGRTKYLAAKPGGTFDFYGIKKFLKNKTAPVIVTDPVVLKITLPDDVKLNKDEHGGSEDKSFIFKGIIPPESIEILV